MRSITLDSGLKVTLIKERRRNPWHRKALRPHDIVEGLEFIHVTNSRAPKHYRVTKGLHEVPGMKNPRFVVVELNGENPYHGELNMRLRDVGIISHLGWAAFRGFSLDLRYAHTVPLPIFKAGTELQSPAVRWIMGKYFGENLSSMEQVC